MDVIDKGCEQEALQRDAAIKNQLNHSSNEPAQWVQDGIVRCIDCGDKIPTARLAIKPNAARCTDCQSAQERN